MKWKIWLNLLTFAALGLLVFFAWHDIVTAFKQIEKLNIWLLLLMLPIQAFVYFALAKLFFHFFKATGNTLPMRVLFPSTLELNFVNHIFPSGGVSGFSYLTLRLKELGVSTAKSTLAQLVRFSFSFVGFILMMLVALVLLAAEGRTSSLVVLAVSAITFTILFGTGVLVYIIGSEHRIAVFTEGMTKIINRVIHMLRPKHPETIRLTKVKHTFLELHKDYIEIRRSRRNMGKLVLWTLITNTAELALLYVVFVAHGEWVNPGAVIIAFVIANIAGFIAILPGGIGLYEPLMTAVLISAGVPAGLALSATLVYRVISLLLSLISGYFLYQKVIHRYGKSSLSSQ